MDVLYCILKNLESICAINDIFMIENVSCHADWYIYIYIYIGGVRKNNN